MLDFSTDEAARFQFGDAWNSWQNAFGQRMQIQAYWSLELIGSRQTTSPISFATGSVDDPSVIVLSGNAARKVLVVKGEASQTENLIEWQDNAGTALGVITADGNVGISSTSPTSTLDVEGSMAMPIKTVAATYTATASDYTILCNANSITINLPQASTVPGRIYAIKKVIATTGTITIDPNSSELIDGAATATLTGTARAGMIIQSDGSAWYILANK
jgi:hypothetical protein